MSDFKLYDHSDSALVAGHYRYGIVAARFNQNIVNALLEGATSTLQQSGAAENQITVVRVPGAFEIPLCCQRLAETGRFDALIALGCVIRGDTPHFDYVCSESARGVMDVGLKYDLPVINGIITTNDLKQAQIRAQPDGDNKGADAAKVAMEMLDVFLAIRGCD